MSDSENENFVNKIYKQISQEIPEDKEKGNKSFFGEELEISEVNFESEIENLENNLEEKDKENGEGDKLEEKDEDIFDIQDPAYDWGFDYNLFSNNIKELENYLKEIKIEEKKETEKKQEKNQEKNENYIILKNIGEDTTVEEIQDFLERCGEIKYIKLMTDPYPRVYRHFAIIDFVYLESKLKALTLHRTFFKNKLISITTKKNFCPSNYIIRECKNLNYHIYMNNNDGISIFSNKFKEQEKNCNSYFGPIKARTVLNTNKIFEPY